MSEQLELQSEEREALQSIYEGDAAFKECNPTTFQYKYGEEDNYKSFLIEVKWGENYPNEIPTINMDTFYNRNLIPAVKGKIHKVISDEAQQWLGCGSTYTLFECIKDRMDELTADQPEQGTTAQSSIDLDSVGVSAIKISESADPNKKKDSKKEQLTKSQKRRQWERTDHKGDRPRGFDWVDLVKHLSQTGSKEDNASTSVAVSTIMEPLNI